MSRPQLPDSLSGAPPSAPEAGTGASVEAQTSGDTFDSADRQPACEAHSISDEEIRTAVRWFHEHSVIQREVWVGDHYETHTLHLAPIL